MSEGRDPQKTPLGVETAQKDAATARWTVDDILNTEHAYDFRVSPDGRRVVWVKGMPDKEKGQHVAHLMLTTQVKEIQLTRGDVDCTLPRWSPDGEHIAFIAARPLPKEVKIEGGDEQPKQQLWVMSVQGGEPWHLTASARGVQNFEWANAETIVFAAQEDRTLYELALKEHKDESTAVDDEEHEPPVRLFQVTLKDRQVVRLSDNADRIRFLALSPDGRYAVTVHERSLHYEYDHRIKPVVFLYDLQEGTRRQILDDLYVQHLAWAHAGDGLYVVTFYGRHLPNVMAAISRLAYYDLARGEAVEVPLDWERGLAFWEQTFDVTGDGFVTLLADGVRPRAARYTRRAGADDWQRTWLSGEHASNLSHLAMGPDGTTLLYDYTTASTPDQWYRARLEGPEIKDPAPITHLNAHLEKKTRARTEVVRWRGALDDEVEGMLYYPHDYQPGRVYPLVLMIHGGPMWADMDAWDDAWSYPQNLMNQRGAFVLKPNYHGSAFYGLDWVESIGQGHYYDLEVPDIERGVDALIERGLVDPQKLGVMGWSNGAILTIALTVTTERYRAASAGAGDVDWASDWGNCAFGASFDHFYMGATPIENPELYRQKSPFYRLDRVHTPTLIFFGDQDTAVPTQQGWMHFRALQQLGQTEVRFVLFPGEKHSFKKQSSWRRKLNEELAWFDRHLFQNVPVQNAALKPNAPLDVALKRQRAARVDGRYGVERNGVLAPETVPYKGLEVGRFEVTRAQYQAFDPNYALAPGTENYPASGISFEQARAYCAWLSGRTGEIYRLGDQAEMELLYQVEGRLENTLDYWAGYPVNPEDAARLREAAAELEGPAPLLYPVGHFQAADPEQPVFDLGGNVAEWAVGAHGGGWIMGGSADTPADRRIDRRVSAPEYVGLRVVKGQKGGG